MQMRLIMNFLKILKNYKKMNDFHFIHTINFIFIQIITSLTILLVIHPVRRLST